MTTTHHPSGIECRGLDHCPWDAVADIEVKLCARGVPDRGASRNHTQRDRALGLLLRRVNNSPTQNHASAPDRAPTPMHHRVLVRLPPVPFPSSAMGAESSLNRILHLPPCHDPEGKESGLELLFKVCPHEVSTQMVLTLVSRA